MRYMRGGFAAVGVTVVLLIIASNAGASFPGTPSRIAFVLYQNDPANGRDIYTIASDGTGEQRLTTSPGDDTSPKWSPDGTRIAFVSNRDGNAELYVMNADGTGQTRLTNDADIERRPSWTPDGRILFARGPGDLAAYRLYLIKSDGTGLSACCDTGG